MRRKKKKRSVDRLSNTSLSAAFKTLSHLLCCTQNAYISSVACTAQKILLSYILVLIHLFKFVLSTDCELLTNHILNIVKIIPVTCYMSLRLFLIEKMNI